MQRSNTKTNESVLFKFENLNIKNIPTLYNNSSTIHHHNQTIDIVKQPITIVNSEDVQRAYTEFDEIKWLTGC